MTVIHTGDFVFLLLDETDDGGNVFKLTESPRIAVQPHETVANATIRDVRDLQSSPTLLLVHGYDPRTNFFLPAGVQLGRQHRIFFESTRDAFSVDHLLLVPRVSAPSDIIPSAQSTCHFRASPNNVSLRNSYIIDGPDVLRHQAPFRLYSQFGAVARKHSYLSSSEAQSSLFQLRLYKPGWVVTPTGCERLSAEAAALASFQPFLSLDECLEEAESSRGRAALSPLDSKENDAT